MDKLLKTSCNGCTLWETWEFSLDPDSGRPLPPKKCLVIRDKQKRIIMGPQCVECAEVSLMLHWNKTFSKWRSDSLDMQTWKEIAEYCHRMIKLLEGQRRMIMYGFIGTVSSQAEKEKALKRLGHYFRKWERRSRLAGVTKFQNAFIAWM